MSWFKRAPRRHEPQKHHVYHPPHPHVYHSPHLTTINERLTEEAQDSPSRQKNKKAAFVTLL